MMRIPARPTHKILILTALTLAIALPAFAAHHEKDSSSTNKQGEDVAIAAIDAFIESENVDKGAKNWKTSLSKPPQVEFSADQTYFWNLKTNVGDIKVKDMGPVTEDIGNMLAAMQQHEPIEGFMNAASPGVIALFQPNKHYATQDAYLEALADAMAAEYRAIVDAGLVLQLDSPDLGLGRHMLFKDKSDEEYEALAAQHVDALNHALDGIPKDRVRLHVCWGNYEGPHHHDAPMEMVLPIALRANVGALLFESSNPRHAHEWSVFADSDLPDDLILIPGVIDSTTNFIEHPKLVAERICRFADIVGRDRVIAGTDCGFATFAGFGAVDEDIVFAKLESMAAGARIASERLWS